jgi:hypothetical protein
MISAEHKKWADWIFHHYLNRLLKRHFFRIYLLNLVPDFDCQKPLLLLPNHSSWWDGFFIYLLNKKLLHRKIYLMMLEEQLKQNRFFRFLGAYSIKTDTFKKVRESLQYTLSLLNRKENPPLVCIFPQGELLPWYSRPILLKRGFKFILNNIKTEINLCFLGIRIEFLGEQRPEVFIEFSPVKKIIPAHPYSLLDFESEFNSLLSQVENKIVKGEKGQVIFQGNKSINEKFLTYRKRRN